MALGELSIYVNICCYATVAVVPSQSVVQLSCLQQNVRACATVCSFCLASNQDRDDGNDKNLHLSRHVTIKMKDMPDSDRPQLLIGEQFSVRNLLSSVWAFSAALDFCWRRVEWDALGG